MKVSTQSWGDDLIRRGRCPPCSPEGGSARASTDELLDPRCGPRQAVAIEEIRRGVRDPVLRPVEVVGAGGRVDGVAHRDLVTDDEDRLFGAVEELPERARVSP